MDVVFLAPAQAEFAEAVVYYNTQRGGLGRSSPRKSNAPSHASASILRRGHCCRGVPVAAQRIGFHTTSCTRSVVTRCSL